MRRLLKEIEDDEINRTRTRTRLLSFKEFCRYVYEPSKKLRQIRLSQDERIQSNSSAERASPMVSD